MSLITRCPACQTLFRVVPDQLRISGGWVRCGRCDEVFDASLHLIPKTQEAAQKDAHSAPDLSRFDQASAGAPIESKPAKSDPERQPMKEDAKIPEFESDAELAEAAFLRDKGRRSYWNKPIMRMILHFLSWALLLGLAGQIVFQERNRIASIQPGIKPLLQVFCIPLKCSLTALQEKKSVAIDSASFSKTAGGSYRLNFTLKNKSNVTLAIPAIELTLTDLQDQAVLRRVFLSPDFAFKSDTMAADAERSASLVMSIHLAGSVQQIVGYRLYAFYP